MYEVRSKGVDFEMFRELLENRLTKEPQGKGGRPPYDYVMMFKIMILGLIDKIEAAIFFIVYYSYVCSILNFMVKNLLLLRFKNHQEKWYLSLPTTLQMLCLW